MKRGIHPNYQTAKVICACGNQFETKSTTPEIHVEICSTCHPFFTGKHKLVDTAGRVDRFRSKMEASQKLREQRLEQSNKKVEKELKEGKTEEANAELNEDMNEIAEELQEETVQVQPETLEQPTETEETTTEE